MNFRDDYQRARACRALLGTVGQQGLWRTSGPTAEALRLLHAGEGALSVVDSLMLTAAFAFWNGDGFCPLGRLFVILDHDRLTAICELAIAMSGKDAARAIDRWVLHYERWLSLGSPS